VRQLRIGEDVLAGDGERLGHVERIVVDESGHRVTHLVVHGRAVDLSRFQEAGPDGLAVDFGRPELDGFPSAEEGPFAAPGEHWRAPIGYRLENFLAMAGALFGQAPYQPPTDAHLPPQHLPHEITSGSPVWSGDVHLGHVSRVLTDESGTTTAIVLQRAGALGENVVVPAGKVVEMVGNNVHVSLTEAEAEALAPYRDDSGGADGPGGPDGDSRPDADPS
jgi:hypothetical protein